MKANSYIKFTNILDLIQLHVDSLARSLSIGRIDLPKIGIRGSLFTAPHRLSIAAEELKPNDANVALSDSAKPTLLGETHAEGTSARFHPLRERGNTGNHQLPTHQSARRHRSIDWRWQSQLINWF
ncbi:hypothetical protein [Chamaesiphon polymorphus]|uniref:hypothetical protein n=1 Tax=Chamaesiphon polymorphus TaxID=2107691 RepID=UPI0011B1F9AB|nr:hypothetical protein [Chamaesiphon polymorphus]